MMAGVVATGFAVGLLVGLTGMGGGLLMTPLLILLYGFSPTMAVGTDLVYAAVTKLAGGLQHVRQNTVDWNIVKRLSLGSIPGGMAGVLLIQLWKRTTQVPVEDMLGQLLGLTFILVSLVMLWQLVVKRKTGSASWLSRIPLSLFGFFGGLLVGLTSVGSGSLFMAVLMACTAMTAPVMVGTDVVHAFFLTMSAGLLHASLGHVDTRFVAWLLVGSVPGILIGGRLTLKIPEKLLRVAIILVLLLTGVKMI